MPRAFFYCLDEPDVHQSDVVALAEGLRDLGYTLSANCAYWQLAPDRPDTLLPRTAPTPPADTDLVVLSAAWTRAVTPDGSAGFRDRETPLPRELFAAGRRYRTLTHDCDDNYGGRGWSTEYARFDVILRSHFNRRCHQPANHRPWALGLTDRVLACTANPLPWSRRRAEILWNFGASHPFTHPVRERSRGVLAAAAPQFTVNSTRDDLTRIPDDPADALMWRQTQHCHSRAYYERLCSSQAVAAFCGDLIPATPHFPRYLIGGGQRARWGRRAHSLFSRLHRAPERLIQWDSWRFWEALAAGCLVYHLDLDHYGVELPVRPEPFVHYVPVRLDDPAASFAPFRRDPQLAERIAQQGRDWALRHYTPRALATRALEALAA